MDTLHGVRGSPTAENKMMIDKFELSTIDESSDQKVTRQAVASGGNFKSLLLSILSGQEVSSHSHAGYEVLLIPQKGLGSLFSEGDAGQTDLECGSIYTEHDGSSFGLRNNGSEPFQVLVILVVQSGTRT